MPYFLHSCLPSQGLAAAEQRKTFLPHQSVDGSSFQLRAKRQLFHSELFAQCFLACLDTLKVIERDAENLFT